MAFVIVNIAQKTSKHFPAWSFHALWCKATAQQFLPPISLTLPDRMYVQWRIARLKELWFLWDEVIRKEKSSARFIPNGFPDKLITGQFSDFFFADQQGRSGLIPPWSNGLHAKQLRATMGMKPQIGIFSVGHEEQYRWKDSVQSEAELRIWAS